MKMKTRSCHEKINETKVTTKFAGLCRACAQKVLTQINRVKEAILAESSASLASHRHALRLALNEAEALAWQTMYPHLVFPALAMEKAQVVAAWNERQQRVWRANSNFALAV